MRVTYLEINWRLYMDGILQTKIAGSCVRLLAFKDETTDSKSLGGHSNLYNLRTIRYLVRGLHILDLAHHTEILRV